MKKFSNDMRICLIFAGLFCISTGITLPVPAQSTVYAISWNPNHRLIRMGAGGAGATVVGQITGTNNFVVKGLDFRPATGQLYALTGNSKLYIIDRRTAVGTFVASLSVPISSESVGFSFDPVTDRIRIITTSLQNFSVNPNDGTVIVETPITPASGFMKSATHTNSYKGATSTTLYVVTGLGILNVMSNPSSGVLTQIGGTNWTVTGIDIAPIPGTTVGEVAISTGVGESPGAFGTINLATGAATPGAFFANHLALESVAVMPDRMKAAKVDYDRDKRTDYSVFRPASNSWYALRSTDNAFTAATWGIAGDIHVPGDYDGDEQTDIAVWRPATGDFHVRRSSDGAAQSVHFGQNGDEPVAEDFDGDGRTDFAVVRRAGRLAAWYYLESSTGTFRALNWGLNTDTIAPADYDGDGKCDIAVRRGAGAAPATFYILGSTVGYYGVPWGLGSDIITPGDYDGDGKFDLAVVRPEAPYKWYILRSSNQAFVAYHFGAPTHIPAPGDYDADGKTDPTVFIPASGDFYSIQSSSGNISGVHFGQNGDVPVAKYDTR